MRLFCHPDTSCPWITGIDGKISPLGFGLIRLEFTMTGEMARLKSAPTEDPLSRARAGETCQHTPD
jgi:hypothetical protein